ncbi:hypothetical protein D4M69_15935 [Enterococcus faecalis]|uniref:Uncharacterized protein n=2 Tax=Enterococcus faecalis TaxID=1351 RepID=Q839L7_ENTFA|nr:hypothetical protein EF_0147 [Enterococcus faecalis V583]AWQ38465.1 hypothetical protein CNQ40_00730 [Enterococcus faecalis]EET98150.1 predicted protein [Enterococcus faecalis T2]EFU90195.1 hypothetical protein HMPREF9511_01819 [Enterococcus faecalis TX0630]ERL11747.1 hypothetical protein HMPREF1160_3069 [Enterococcus faecalis E12]KDE18897.1 hypothetical protein HMPREF2097_00084 [Enterococcus faecalis 918]
MKNKKIANQNGWLIVLKAEESTKFRSQPVSAGQQKINGLSRMETLK